MHHLDFYFILVEPAVAENIGAAARAIKTMGFQQLRLVNPRAELRGKAEWVAHGSADVLQQAQVYTGLHEAISDLDLLLGSTAKKRSVKFDFYSLPQIPDLLHQKGESIQKVGMLFGREESGLTNQELQQCDVLFQIPMSTTFPSLNLSQAVMVVAYQLKMAFGETKSDLKEVSSQDALRTGKFKAFKDKVSDILEELGVSKNPVLSQRIMERLSSCPEDDINLFFSVFQAYDQHRSSKD